jgi:hypothetical protein
MLFQTFQEASASRFYVLAIFFDIVGAEKRFLRIRIEIATQENMEQAGDDEQRTSSGNQSDHFFLLSC